MVNSIIMDFPHGLNNRAESVREKRIASIIWTKHKKFTSCFVPSSVMYLRMELMRFSSL